ncbi:hypothetical protein Pan44_27810 [Caulifigura coniformis]|uniref:3-keto-alpha-glucoside-1,2-lyase/3-keto-2-hydroxy-glucal hydratase domain-containing protein n=1 Tax=Caulifigura coniformis TaxID=2527983 RepID=A0A517SF26_9PLAN|nr:DUF1080 domain-containing protein [Caulifigura coniformis]QDT54745.1 hypothetical protein Pan44_27810 [Caulifigura coniformis]
MSIRILVTVLTVLVAASSEAADVAWLRKMNQKIPASETKVRLFNAQTLDGWQGQKEKYWTVDGGTIIGSNTAGNAPAASTYLVTDKPYKNFRLIFESKLVESEMHTGIAFWGHTIEMQGDPFSYKGHLVMYPSKYGFFDLYGRRSIYQDKDGVAQAAGRQHDWNRMEILAIAPRIRHVINGKLVADWTDPLPETCVAGPIGLQLHSNKVAQEVHWKGLLLTENPEDLLISVEE